MAFAKTFGAQPTLLGAHIITIETDLTKGLHAFTVVGLPDKAIEESRDRVSAAIKNSGWKPPKQHNQKITVSLAPADQKKEGPVFDLPIALAFLLASKDVSFESEGKLFVGELALDGSVRPIKGALAIASEAKRRGVAELYIPTANADEAALVEGVMVFAVDDLKSLVLHLDPKLIGHKEITPHPRTELPSREETNHEPLFANIRGQEIAKRGLAIAMAGGHNIALWGPPGTGKTMLARAATELLPPLALDEALEVTSIHSVAGALKNTIITEAPFRSPHHTSSYVSIIGGGTIPKPGEATLAHRGILFMDEFPEFDKRVIESLRQPLEEGIIHVSRARGSERFPARFLLITAMNPCPCGYFGDPKRRCSCPPQAIARYQRKISGPIIDRIDIWIEVPRIEHETLTERGGKEKLVEEFTTLKTQIASARKHQHKRFTWAGTPTMLNAHMTVSLMDKLIQLSPEVRTLLTESAKRLDLSPRAFHRMIKLARTIADLEDAQHIAESHVLEALQYRPKKLFEV